MIDLSFMDSALCAQIGPRDDLWNPEKGGVSKAAKTTCRRCPVIEPCLAYALADPTLDGVWAATSPGQRERLRGGTKPCGRCGVPVPSARKWCATCRPIVRRERDRAAA